MSDHPTRTDADVEAFRPSVLLFVTLLLLVLVASPLSAASGPRREAPPAELSADLDPAEAHPEWASGEAGIVAAPALVSFDRAVAATATEAAPDEPRFHLQGDYEQHQPGGVDRNGASLPPGSDIDPPPQSAADSLEPLAPGDLSAQFQGLTNTGWIPPDTILAVGPTTVVEAVNSGFAVYTKNGGTLQGYTTYANFLASLLPAGFQGVLFDPRVLYSPEHSRYVMLILGLDTINQNSYFFIMVSQTTDPTGNWWVYTVAAESGNAADTDAWVDYCGLGADSWGAYVTCNMFRWTGSFKYGKLWSFDPPIFSGGTTHSWAFWDLRWNDNSSAFSLQPAQPYSIAFDTATFFVNTFSSSGNRALLWRMTGDRGNAPTLTRSTINTQSYFAIGTNVDQPTVSTDLDGGDARIQNVAYKDRRVYAVLTSDPDFLGLRSGWLLVKLNVDTSTLDWQELTASNNGFFYFYPAITLDGYGDTSPNLAIFGSWTDTETAVTPGTQYASALFKIYVNQPNDNSGPFVSFASGVDWYIRLDSSGRNRWGDYSGAAFDWSTGNVWGAAETAGFLDTWRTYLRGMEIADASCPTDLTLSNTTLTGDATYRAVNQVTLGPSLTVNGSTIRVYAGGRVVIGSGTHIGGSFRAGTPASPCTAAPAAAG